MHTALEGEGRKAQRARQIREEVGRAQVSGLMNLCSVALGKSLDLSEPQFPLRKMGTVCDGLRVRAGPELASSAVPAHPFAVSTGAGVSGALGP